MKKLLLAALCASALASPTRAVDVTWVTVGDPGNACDEQVPVCVGGVSYPYRIGKYEVTNAQYAEFLNAVAADDPSGLYHPSMYDAFSAGIERSGSPGSYSYGVTAGREDMPVIYVSFWDALRFANWLHNGQPTGAQGSGTTEDGAYTITLGGMFANSIVRNPGAGAFLTSLDEWHKAAYYDPSTETWYDFPAGSNAETTCAAPGPTPNTANCSEGDLTEVGSYTGAASPNGTFDQGGNMYEWDEAIVGPNRNLRGGHFFGGSTPLQASFGLAEDPSFDGYTGFRVASPSPSTSPFVAPLGTLNTNAGTDSGSDVEPDVASDGAGTWVAVWRSLNDLAGGTGDSDIHSARSTDDGGTWTSPVALSASLPGTDIDPIVATDGSGSWVSAWRSNDTLGGTIDSDLDILFARSTDGGSSWSAPAALGTNADTDSGADDFVKLAAAAGTWIAVWHSADSLEGTIGTDNDILLARSTDGGQTWSPPAAIDANATADSLQDTIPHVATDGLGNWVVVWQTKPLIGGDNDILVTRSSDDGLTWAPVTSVNDAGSDGNDSDITPKIATDRAGGWLAAWTVSRVGHLDADLYVARSADAGATWTTPALLNTNAAFDTASDADPDLAAEAPGRWVAVWRSQASGGGTFGTDRDILMSRSTNGGLTWSPPAALNSEAETDVGADEQPAVRADGNGRLVSVWHSSHDLGGGVGTDTDIFFRRSELAPPVPAVGSTGLLLSSGILLAAVRRLLVGRRQR